jgi:cytochrome P450
MVNDVASAPMDRLEAFFRIDPDALRNPGRLLAEIRDESASPVLRSEAVGAYVVAGYAECVEALMHTEVFSSTNIRGAKAAALDDRIRRLAAVAPEMSDLVGRGYGADGHVQVLVNADPPQHTRQRALVMRPFSPRRIGSYEEITRSIARELSGKAGARGGMEFVSEFGVPLPVRVLATALGVDQADVERYKLWAVQFTRVLGRLDVGEEEIVEIAEHRKEFDRYFINVIDDRLRTPRDDFMTDFAQGAVAGEQPLSLDEMLQVIEQLIVAGHETTARNLANAIVLLIENPDLQARLGDDPGLIPRFVEEALRLETSAPAPFRLAKADFELGGVKIPAGSPVILAYTAANRDPAVFPDPHRIDLQREGTKPHLTFAWGPHYCIGNALARMEMRVGLEELLAAVRDIRLEGGGGRESIRYAPSFTLHGPARLPIVTTARRDPPAA